MKNYVLVLPFNASGKRIVAMEKKRPAWQAGKLNFPGGSIEPTDSCPVQAAVRELREETGLVVLQESLNFVAFVRWFDDGNVECANCHVFSLFDDVVEHAKTIEDERVFVMDSDQLLRGDVIDNLRWMVPMAISRSSAKEVIERNGK
jgi:8-oxo-dGTP diphosphatase